MVDYRVNTFLVLYEAMNYRATAEKLNITQPAVTQHIQMLEREYGCKLFIYNRKKLIRTPEAEKLAMYFREVLYNEARFRSELSPEADIPLRMGATKTIGEFVLTDAVESYLETPGQSLLLYVDNTKNLLGMLEDGQLDFALIEGSFDKDKYGSRLFRNEPFIGMCAKEHRFAVKEVSIEELMDNTLIIREKGSGTRAILEQLLWNYGYKIEDFSRSVCISNFSVISRLVADNVGISFAYKAVADSADELETFSIKNAPLTHEFNYVYLKNTNAVLLIDDFSSYFKTQVKHRL